MNPTVSTRDTTNTMDMRRHYSGPCSQEGVGSNPGSEYSSPHQGTQTGGVCGPPDAQIQQSAPVTRRTLWT
ncbi:hypothetical protein M8J76_000102 [Diaphorina citri]|nr:hypothetical protein M8J75_011184 [Diaphorina citri]KAI5716053.1 hypothetical protein M8J76_000102 [Diaphorina citri]